MTISIIGLGWLGATLAQSLLEKGYRVKGSTRQAEKRARLVEAGIETKILTLDPQPEGDHFEDLFQTDVLIINIPPSRRTKPDTFHPQQVMALKRLTLEAGIPKIIYVSSTAVYPDRNQIARESDPLSPDNTGNPVLVEAEKLLWQDKAYDLTVIRLGGLLGDDRIPGKYFSSKENIVGHSPVNYIHRTDAVRAILWVIEKGLWNETFNLVCPAHPQKKEVIEKNAKELGLLPPASYDCNTLHPWKSVSPEKFIATGFDFIYENPLLFTYILHSG